jgi:hypothetical protein
VICCPVSRGRVRPRPRRARPFLTSSVCGTLQPRPSPNQLTPRLAPLTDISGRQRGGLGGEARAGAQRGDMAGKEKQHGKGKQRAGDKGEEVINFTPYFHVLTRGGSSHFKTISSAVGKESLVRSGTPGEIVLNKRRSQANGLTTHSQPFQSWPTVSAGRSRSSSARRPRHPLPCWRCVPSHL